jgi:hypothetical protein
MIVQHIESLHRTEGISYRDICIREGVPYANFVRWKGKMNQGEEVVSRPGPKKVESLDLAALERKIKALKHGRKHTAGTGELYARHRRSISRRDLGTMVAKERQSQNRERDRVYHRVSWKVPRLVWATDDTEYHPDKAYPKAYLHNVQDLGSRYKFEPLVGLGLAHGDEVAGHLCDLFERYGPPLFLKRDNAGNLNHHIVEELLQAFLVIPVNSPTYYPQYNGGIEVGQREIKDRLVQRSQPPSAFLAIQAELDIQALNHKRRPCLKQRTACAVFTQGEAQARRFTRRRRKEVYDAIRETTLEIVETQALDGDAAWRLAVETWLLDNGFITVFNK